jgi:hypothetical protein
MGSTWLWCWLGLGLVGWLDPTDGLGSGFSSVKQSGSQAGSGMAWLTAVSVWLGPRSSRSAWRIGPATAQLAHPSLSSLTRRTVSRSAAHRPDEQGPSIGLWRDPVWLGKIRCSSRWWGRACVQRRCLCRSCMVGVRQNARKGWLRCVRDVVAPARGGSAWHGYGAVVDLFG